MVIIAGAGPTGLALACGLRQFGVDVRIVDAAEGPATTSRALGLQPRGGRCWPGWGRWATCRTRRCGCGRCGSTARSRWT
uniref:FAD-dependent monooxygenase n=1 Tax=Lentzea alba TaxID=2714351 RepID=UPI0039BFAB8B